MKIPEKLILFAEEYKILSMTQEQMNKLDGDKDTEGMIIPKKKLIILVNNKKIDKEEVLWHEIGHYFLSTFGYKDNEQGAEAFAGLIIGINNQLKGKKVLPIKLTRKDTK